MLKQNVKVSRNKEGRDRKSGVTLVLLVLTLLYLRPSSPASNDRNTNYELG